MARSQFDVDGVIRTVNLDDPPARGLIVQSILLAQLIDELTGRPIGGQARVESATPHARGRSAAFGVCGLVGCPAQAFPLLNNQPYTAEASFTAEGYQSVGVVAPIAQQPTFPDVFVGADVGAVALRRNPVLLSVRAVSLDAQLDTQPVSGAIVEITGIWRRTGDLTNAAASADVISIHPALSVTRPVGATVEPVVVTPIVEPIRSLIASVAMGDRRLFVDHAGTLAPGDVVSLDSTDPDRTEHIEVESVAAAADPDSPATITLRFAARHAHASGVVVERVNVVPSGPPTAALTSDALPGDTTAFVNSMTPFAADTAVRIVSGGQSDEIHLARRYSITTGPDGYGRFPLLGRVAAIQLSATGGALSAGPITVTPDYGVAENATHITLT